MNVGLKQGAVGTEVERLHRVLTSLGIAVADDEREGKAFGPSLGAPFGGRGAPPIG